MKTSTFWKIVEKPLIMVQGKGKTIENEIMEDCTIMLYRAYGEWNPILLTAKEQNAIKNYDLDEVPQNPFEKLEILVNLLPTKCLKDLATMVMGSRSTTNFVETVEEYFN